MQRRFVIGLLATGLVSFLTSQMALAAPLGAVAPEDTFAHRGALLVGNVPLGGPPNSYNAEQNFNFEIGQIAAYLKACGYFPLSQDLRSFMTDAEAYQRGYGTLAGADGVTGGCARLKNSVEEWVEEQRAPRG